MDAGIPNATLPLRQKSNLIKVGEELPQAPEGTYIVQCVHVEPNWTYFMNRKIALYFEVVEGPYRGYTARRFYPLTHKQDDSYEAAPKGKFMKDILRLFPEKTGACELDPVELFKGKYFDVTVTVKPTKDGTATNSLVTKLNHHNPGW